MAWIIVQNKDGSATLKPIGMSVGTEFKVDHKGDGTVVTAFGTNVLRDTARVRMTNGEGENVFVSGADAQNAVVVAGTEPV
jgi:hypothetical protein